MNAQDGTQAGNDRTGRREALSAFRDEWGASSTARPALAAAHVPVLQEIEQRLRARGESRVARRIKRLWCYVLSKGARDGEANVVRPGDAGASD